jgi:cystathionine beta-lyase
MTERYDPFAVLTLDALRSRHSAKWRHYHSDVLPLWVAEMDVPLAAPIANALRRLIDSADTGYPGDTPYRESFASYATDTWNWDPTVARTRAVASVIGGYTDALVEAVGIGGTVVVTSPVYPPFYSYLKQAGVTVVEAPLTADLRLDLAALDETFDTASGFLLCNPHNPGGTVHTREELEAVAALAQKHDVQVVADEIHAPIVYEGESFVPYLTVDPRGLALHAASKAWNLAAMPAALLVFGADASAALERHDAGKHHAPTYWGVVAQTSAYAESRVWLEDALASLDRNRHLLGELLAQRVPGARYHVPASTYLTWVDCRELALGDDPAAVFLERGRVAFNSGPTFGTGGAGHVRINIATSPAILTEAVSRMAASL